MPALERPRVFYFLIFGILVFSPGNYGFEGIRVLALNPGANDLSVTECRVRCLRFGPVGVLTCLGRSVGRLDDRE